MLHPPTPYQEQTIVQKKNSIFWVRYKTIYTGLLIYSTIRFRVVLIFVAAVTQDYTTDATHKVYVIIGNSALIKCEIPSFVSDFLSVINWVDNEGIEYFPSVLGKIIMTKICKVVET